MNNGNKSSVETIVKERYAKGADEVEEALCCPVDYDPKYLKKIPQEILDKDYGCGDPSKHLKEGDIVLDLGSGGGKICYIASQIVGPEGKVIGVDFNPAMLELSRKYQNPMAKEIGWANVEFRRGRIQDLKTSLDDVEALLKEHPIQSIEDLDNHEVLVKSQQSKKPLIASDSIDVVVSNCVLNLVKAEEKKQLFKEIYRVLKKGGRIAISDIVSDEEVPQHLQDDTKLWSGCISGAFQEKAFLKAFEEAGFYGISIEKRDEKPWQTVEGIEFRSLTVTAYKGKEGECWERNQAVIYKGPWKQVVDDDQHVLKRGVRTAVCDKTFQIYTKKPYSDHIIPVEPLEKVPMDEAKPYDCSRTMERDPRETKGQKYDKTEKPESVCLDGGCC